MCYLQGGGLGLWPLRPGGEELLSQLLSGPALRSWPEESAAEVVVGLLALGGPLA